MKNKNNLFFWVLNHRVNKISSKGKKEAVKPYINKTSCFHNLRFTLKILTQMERLILVNKDKEVVYLEVVRRISQILLFLLLLRRQIIFKVNSHACYLILI